MAEARGIAERSSGAAVAATWRWFVALGIGLLALSVAAWINAVAIAVASAVVIGASLLAGGVLHILHFFVAGHRRSAALSLCCGILYAIGGLLAMGEPVHGAAVLTLLLAITVVTGGILRIAAILVQSRRHWRLLLLGGIASIVVGALIYLSLPWPGLWVLGVLIAIELFIQGSGWFYIGLVFRAG